MSDHAAPTWPGRVLGALLPNPRGRDWSYEGLLALAIGAETCVLYLAAEAVFNTGARLDATVSPLILFAILYVGTQVQRWLDLHYVFSPDYEIVMVVGFCLTLLVAVRLIAYPHVAPGDFGWLSDAVRDLAFFHSHAEREVWGVVLLVAYAWWRGRTRDEAGIDSAYRELRFGTAAGLALLLLAVTRVPGAGHEAIWRGLYGAVIGFYLCALGAVALARLRVEQARGTLVLTPRWLLTFGWPVLALLAVGTILAGLFTRRLLDTVVWLLTPVFIVLQLLLLAMVYVATGVAWVVFAVFTWILARLGPNVTPTPVTPAAQATPQPFPYQYVRPVHYPDAVRYLVALALLGAIVWLLTRFLWRRHRRAGGPAGEVRESIFTWGLLGEGAAGALRRLRGRLRRPDDPLAHLRGDPRWRHTLAIREIYARLLRRGAAAALPRAAGETPDEYEGTLGRRFRAARAAAAALTARYDAARYGDEPASAADAAVAGAAWDEFRQAAPERAHHHAEAPDQ
ncbi:MAG TPA: DUF4129 domain-containing protein [Thermomicrobiales bacterium]|nr:DUF4129 domain-containing protein [Thermomicrobiales bacterium]